MARQQLDARLQHPVVTWWWCVANKGAGQVPPSATITFDCANLTAHQLPQDAADMSNLCGT
jgi:hypothetical protein